MATLPCGCVRADNAECPWHIYRPSRDGSTPTDLDALVREIAGCGVEHDDDRMNYLTVQIDRDLWNRVQEIAQHPATLVEPD